MATKYYQQHPERSGFADAGLMIAFAVIIVTTLKLWMYGITVVTLAWLAVSLVYIAVAAATKPRNPLRTGFTAFFMVISIVAVYASFQYDYPLSPKRESNIRAEQDENQIQDKNRQIKVDTPKPVVVETDVVSDDVVNYEEVSVAQHNDYADANVVPEDDESIELIDLSANSNDDNTQNDSHNNNYSDDVIEEQVTEQFDESFE